MAGDQVEPVRLEEDSETGDLFLVYGTQQGLRIDIRYEGETLWMTQAQIGQLFGVDRSVITKHIANIYEEGELGPESTRAKIAQVRREGLRQVSRQIEHYDLDMVISVGYRVSSAQATLFRRWATGILVQFAKKGFVVDTRRLKDPGNAGRIAELREVIRDLRSEEANLYQELRQICSMCQDYDGSAAVAREFFQRTQAKLVYAVTSHTPAEVVSHRADCEVSDMGLRSWPAENIRKQDVTVSKNYLTEAEIKELNRLTSILLDIFEDQLDIGRLVLMEEARQLLDRQLQNLGRAVLRGGGSVSADQAKVRAEAQYEEFDRRRKLERRREADAHIAELAAEAKRLPKPPRR
ncbi:DNA-binding protein [Bosea sp. WAO]|nr:DNA-binding protein [Bosea sp. WAO]